MYRTIIWRRLGVFACSTVLATGVVLATGGTAVAADAIPGVDVKLGKNPGGSVHVTISSNNPQISVTITTGGTGGGRG